jgi:flagellar basal-body rod protein FlgG
MDSLDMLANNMANGSTTGFKVDREFYSTFTGNGSMASFDPSVGDAPLVEKPWTDFAQGTLVSTGSSTDLSLSGAGFFAVNGPNRTLYTRNGNFRISASGSLVTAEGYSMRQVGGQPVQLQSQDPIQVSQQGEITQDGQQIGQLEINSFSDPTQLTKAAAGYFENQDPTSNPATAATNVQVSQGSLESANSSPAESAARMVSLLRNFEMLQHAAKIGAEMNKQAVEEVARVPS